jgi:hypothetical protein
MLGHKNEKEKNSLTFLGYHDTNNLDELHPLLEGLFETITKAKSFKYFPKISASDVYYNKINNRRGNKDRPLRYLKIIKKFTKGLCPGQIAII